MLCVVRCSLFVGRCCLLLVVCYLLFGVLRFRCLLFVVCVSSSLLVGWWLLGVVRRCSASVVCVRCLQFVDCCSLAFWLVIA